MRVKFSVAQILLLSLICGACTGAGVGWAAGLFAALAAGVMLLAACGTPDKNNGNNGDNGETITDVGPCLSISEDFGNPDTGPDLSPCLTPPLPDMGSDMGPDMDVGPDASDVGTDDAATDGGGEMGMLPERDEILNRLRDRLPADVAQRLDSSDDDLA